jgi:hypothetical protein
MLFKLMHKVYIVKEVFKTYLVKTFFVNEKKNYEKVISLMYHLQILSVSLDKNLRRRWAEKHRISISKELVWVFRSFGDTYLLSCKECVASPRIEITNIIKIVHPDWNFTHLQFYCLFVVYRHFSSFPVNNWNDAILLEFWSRAINVKLLYPVYCAKLLQNSKKYISMKNWFQCNNLKKFKWAF